MTIKELHDKLSELGIPSESYYLHGLYGSTNDNEKPALTIRKGRYTIEYEVYYRERGTKHTVMSFNEERKATEYILKLLVQK